jgi:inosine-uridine nucleoside N-ribohydrolase
VLDTDTYNEIDDQFAVVHALLSPEHLSVDAIYAAPFFNDRSTGPADGMQRSYDEILRLLSRLGRSPEGFVYKGSTGYLEPDLRPYHSEAAEDLIVRAESATAHDPLIIVAIGATTNISSAMLIEPSIIERTVVVWLGGHALHWPHTNEFNLKQDVVAARLLLDSGVPLVLIPCMGVASHLMTTMPEMERYLRGRGAIGDYLFEIFETYESVHRAWSKVIWDMATIAYLLDPAWVPTELVHSPVLTDQLTWSVDARRHFIRYATHVHRDPIFQDFFSKIERLDFDT